MTERTRKALEIVRLIAELGEYDSNVIGMVAEIIAEEEYGMTKARRGAKDIDGTWFVGENQRTVQVKAFSEKRVKDYGLGTFFRLGLKNPADDLLVLLIHTSEPKYTELYLGAASEAGVLGNLNGSQVRTVNLRQMMLLLPQNIQDELNKLLGRG